MLGIEMSHSLLETELLGSGIGTGRWMVVIFNNDTNSLDEVIEKQRSRRGRPTHSERLLSISPTKKSATKPLRSFPQSV